MQSKGIYIFLASIIAIFLVLNLLLSIVIPVLLILEIIVAICEYFTIRKIKKINNAIQEKERMENKLFKNGYKKIYDNLFINEQKNVVNILGKDYGYSQIIDCQLVQNDSSINNTFGNTKGEIKGNGKIKAKTKTISSENKYCNELYLNITVDDFNNPNIKVNVRGLGLLNTNGERYKKVIEKANEILSLFKLIISKNNEKYTENGIVQKIEHKYIEEESNIKKLEELSRLHKNGELTDYEYSIKKQELLEKIK